MATEERPDTAESGQERAREDARARLDAEVARRRALGQGARDDAQTSAHAAGAAERDARARSFVAKLRSRVPAAFDHPEDEGAGDDESGQETTSRLADSVRTAAWRNSLAAASLDALAEHTLEKLDPTQEPTFLREYVDRLPGKQLLNLAMFGGVGSGKTAAAVALGAYAASTGMLVRIARHADYIAWLRPEGAGPDMPNWKVRDRFTKAADLLILDDVAAGLTPMHAATRHVRDETLTLIDKRLGAGKGTVITTNESPESLEEILGERVISRLQDRGHALFVEHPDRRRARSWF